MSTATPNFDALMAKATPGPFVLRKFNHGLHIIHERACEWAPEKPFQEHIIKAWPENRSGCHRGEVPNWRGWDEKIEANHRLLCIGRNQVASLAAALKDALVGLETIGTICAGESITQEELACAYQEAMGRLDRGCGSLRNLEAECVKD